MKTHYIFKIVGLSFFLSLTGILSGFGQVNVENTLWDDEDFLLTPEYEVVKSDSIESIIFKSLSYKGHRKSVFAYYATPGMLDGNISGDKKLPGIILVHGGGGMAFRDWVVQWAKRGYAALALDTRGNGADKKHIAGGCEEKGGETPYFDVTLPLKEQWLYQAVGDVIKAHTLLLSFPEVDKKRTAITGISWGGVLTCIVSSLDARFKVAVPVYGCGFLGESGRMKQQLDALAEKDRDTWLAQYDPSVYLSRMKRPILFLNGTNDVHFYLSSMTRSAALAKKSRLLIKRGLRHSHKYGWSNEEISAFVNQYLGKEGALPCIRKESIGNGVVKGQVSSPVSIEKVTLYYTTSEGAVADTYHWRSVSGDLYGRNWEVTVPDGAKIWFVNLTDTRGYQISGKVYRR